MNPIHVAMLIWLVWIAGLAISFVLILRNPVAGRSITNVATFGSMAFGLAVIIAVTVVMA